MQTSKSHRCKYLVVAETPFEGAAIRTYSNLYEAKALVDAIAIKHRLYNDYEIDSICNSFSFIARYEIYGNAIFITNAYQTRNISWFLAVHIILIESNGHSVFGFIRERENSSSLFILDVSSKAYKKIITKYEGFTFLSN